MVEENIQLDKIDEELLARRTRMRTAIKGLAGWVSYLMGNGALAIGLFNPFGIEYLSVSIGLFISLASLYLIITHIKSKNLQGKPLVVKLTKTFGGLLFFSGFVFTRVLTEKSSLYNYFFYSFAIGFGLTIFGTFLRKFWKLNFKLQPINK